MDITKASHAMHLPLGELLCEGKPRDIIDDETTQTSTAFLLEKGLILNANEYPNQASIIAAAMNYISDKKYTFVAP